MNSENTKLTLKTACGDYCELMLMTRMRGFEQVHRSLVDYRPIILYYILQYMLCYNVDVRKRDIDWGCLRPAAIL